MRVEVRVRICSLLENLVDEVSQSADRRPSLYVYAYAYAYAYAYVYVYELVPC